MKSKKTNNNFHKLVILPFLALNFIFPVNIFLDLENYEISAILENQSNILTYASLAVIPLQIVQGLIEKHHSSAPSPKDNSKEESKNTNAACELITFDMLKTIKKGGIKSENKKELKYFTGFFFEKVFGAHNEELAVKIAKGSGLVIMFLAFLIFRPRGSIEYYAISILRKIENTANIISGCVFFIFQKQNNGTGVSW